MELLVPIANMRWSSWVLSSWMGINDGNFNDEIYISSGNTRTIYTFALCVVYNNRYLTAPPHIPPQENTSRISWLISPDPKRTSFCKFKQALYSITAAI